MIGPSHAFPEIIMSSESTPALPGETRVSPTADELYDVLAGAMMATALDAVVKRGVFHVALSGGSTPEPFYIRLVTDPRFRAVPWERTHLWIVDERRVSEDHAQSNYRMIRETLADHVPMRKRQRHPMPVLSADPAGEYEAELAGAFGVSPDQPPPSLDFVLLGMGSDCHTASLFPNSSALAEGKRWVAVNDGPGVTPPPRVTMTYPLLNAAAFVAVLVTGTNKAPALARVARQMSTGRSDPTQLPITGITPDSSPDRKLVWFLDELATGIG